MDKQRLYDAMLIKAFRADATVGHLWWWLKGLGIEIPDKTLKRQPPTNKMRVQSFVGTFLKPLADRLWDTDRSQDIDNSELNKNKAVQLPILADVRTALRQLNQLLARRSTASLPKRFTKWREKIDGWKKKYPFNNSVS